MYQFARDAAVADAWLSAQEPYLRSMNLGRNLEEVIALIRKHEAFEKSAQAQDERFHALQKLTNYELKEMQQREMAAEEERRRRAGSPPQGGRRGETTFPAEGGVRTAPEGMSRSELIDIFSKSVCQLKCSRFLLNMLTFYLFVVLVLVEHHPFQADRSTSR